MPPDPAKSDLIKLMHMRDAVEQALMFCRDREKADLATDAMLRRAVLHALQEVGEASRHVTPTVRQQIAGVPWTQVVGMRNHLVHGYFDVNLDLVWNVVRLELPALLAAIKEYLETRT
jgi:uncharacterized protein with HEPN domain